MYSPWLADIDLEVYPIEPATVTTPLGRRVETRQIAILPLESSKQGGEPVLLAARIVDCSMWSKTDAPAMKEVRRRFEKRLTVQMHKLHQKKGPIHLLMGKDYRRLFLEVQQEGWLKGDDLVLCGILFKPDQLICGAAQRDLRWLKGLDSFEDAKKPEAVARARARAPPGNVGGGRRMSAASSTGQSPRHGLHDDTWGTEEGSSCRGETPMPPDFKSDFQEAEEPRRVRVVGDADFVENFCVNIGFQESFAKI